MPSSVGKLLFRQFELTEIHVQLKMFTVCCEKEKGAFVFSGIYILRSNLAAHIWIFPVISVSDDKLHGV